MPHRRALLLAGGALAAPGLARAAWPLDRPIEIIIPAPAASPLDVTGRLVAQHLPRQLPGLRCVAVNRPGAGGQIGFEAIFNAAPDGRTLGMASGTALQTIAIERPTRYDPEAFTFLANIVEDAVGFWVRPASPWTSLEDIRLAARGAPGEIGVGTPGIGSDEHLLLMAFEDAAEVTLLHVPYTRTRSIQRDLVAGTLPLAAFSVGSALHLLRSGRIRGLSQAGPERWSAAADVPTFREGGFNLLGGESHGIVGPPGLPAELTLQLELALKDMLADAEFVQEAGTQALPLRPMVGAAYRRRMLAGLSSLQRQWQRRPWRD
ncbi:tripartite tricarboxylate transporter substrate binding protein [Roseococcus pinisoli]|uniref:Tripartite tricarboxylate transporter substrate binding protein n=1 Tax=Roseococcus pinisoli TaxID=2835040 RepID=A0ABS5QGR0_9PROT|nr:tripartite tricarboxylate transporter substrate binding protein [Roseococcus pinisoli]MBS7812122.1 tripartite tricarboxylate transporter substrate binding protein [Roseococcus pinisoli]